MSRLIPSLLLAIICFSCSAPEQKKQSGSSAAWIKYAKGFTVNKLSDATLVEVLYPYPGAASGYKYLLVERGKKVPAHDADTKVIFTPVNRIVCTATTHLPLLDYLEVSDRLVGFPSLDYVSSEKIRALIEENKITELGVDLGLNIERIALLKPDILMGYTLTGNYGQYAKIEKLGVPVVMNAEYLEEHPLGRAEWIKFMALFFNKEQEADAVFNMIEQNYLSTLTLTRRITERPTVLSGVVYGDAWFLPGGKNYNATLLRDAGCKYLWEEDNSNGYLQLSFEAVYEKAHDANLWIGVASFGSLEEIKNADHRYTKFKPYKNKHVYTYDARKGAKGGSEYLELGYLRPDIILKDLVKIAHPDLLPEYQLYFHAKLQ
jgi:iron complex transport system substrate-binding protein